MKQLLSIVWLFLIAAAIGPTAIAQEACAGMLPPRLQADKYGYVLPLPPTPLSVRTQAGKLGTVFASLAPGTQFMVLDGPICANSAWWWHIKNRQYQMTGWLPEGDKTSRYVEPVLDSGSAQVAPATNGPAGKIAFVGLTDIDDSGHTIYDIYLTNGDGSQRIRVTHDVHASDFSAPPDWSPDDQQIAFEGYLNQHFGLYTINIDGSNLQYLGSYAAPSWFPDGKRLLVSALYPDQTRLYVIDTNGRLLTDITPKLDSASAWCPVLSPDGNQVAFFVRDVEHPYSLFPWVSILDLSTSQLIKVGNWGAGYSATDFGGDCPAWSPESKRVAFSRATKSYRGGAIFVANNDGPSLSTLFETTKDYGYGALAWSPDGAFLVYSAMTTPGKRSIPNDWTLAMIPVGDKLNDANTRPIYIAKGLNPVWRR